jgi:transcriptional regulator with XRE-family HTH domain
VFCPLRNVNGLANIRDVRTERTARQPILGVLAADERPITWLARRTGFTRNYLSMVFHGNRAASAEVRRRCAEALGLPEHVLFHGVAAPEKAA